MFLLTCVGTRARLGPEAWCGESDLGWRAWLGWGLVRDGRLVGPGSLVARRGYIDMGGWGYSYATLVGGLTLRSWLAGSWIGVSLVSVWCWPRTVAVGRERRMALRLVGLEPGWRLSPNGT